MYKNSFFNIDNLRQKQCFEILKIYISRYDFLNIKFRLDCVRNTIIDATTLVVLKGKSEPQT